MMGGTEQIATDSAEILHETVHRQEALGVSCRFEPTHLALSVTRRFMRHLGAVVRELAGDVTHGGHHCSVGRGVARQFVGDEFAWHRALALQQLAEESDRCPSIAS